MPETGYHCNFCECDVVEDGDWWMCVCSTRRKDDIMGYPSEWQCLDARNDGPYDTLQEKYL